MEKDRRRQDFANRFNVALAATGKTSLSDGSLVQLLARKGVAVTPVTVSNWRNGKHMPKLEQIEGIAEILGIDPGQLAFGARQRVAEGTAAYRSGDAEQRDLVESFALLGEDERGVVRELIRVLSVRAIRPDKRPGPRKRR